MKASGMDALTDRQRFDVAFRFGDTGVFDVFEHQGRQNPSQQRDCGNHNDDFDESEAW